MSFSFTATAASKADVHAKVDEQFDAVEQSQPVHARDRRAVLAAASACVDTLVDPAEGECVHVSAAGYLSWRAEGEFTGASVSVTAVVRPAE